jgi:hypothetical protein
MRFVVLDVGLKLRRDALVEQQVKFWLFARIGMKPWVPL